MTRKPKPSPLLIDILAPDPADLGALLAAAVEAHQRATAETGASLAARCIGPGGRPLSGPALTRAARPGSAPREGTVRAVCRALGLRVALVPAGSEAPP